MSKALLQEIAAKKRETGRKDTRGFLSDNNVFQHIHCMVLQWSQQETVMTLENDHQCWVQQELCDRRQTHAIPTYSKHV